MDLVIKIRNLPFYDLLLKLYGQLALCVSPEIFMEIRRPRLGLRAIAAGDGSLDPIKFLTRAQKNFDNLSTITCDKKLLEENLLNIKAIVLSFELFKSSMDEETMTNNPSLKKQWPEMETKYKSLLDKIDNIINVWTEYERLRDKLQLFLDKICRHHSVGSFSSSKDGLFGSKTTTRKNLNHCRVLYAQLKNAGLRLKNQFQAVDLNNESITLEKRIQEIFQKERLNSSSQSLYDDCRGTPRIESRLEAFLTRLDAVVDSLKIIQNKRRDFHELPKCLDLIKVLELDKKELETRFKKFPNFDNDNLTVEDKSMSESTRSDRYLKKFKGVQLSWNRFVDELNKCQSSLENHHGCLLIMEADFDQIVHDLDNTDRNLRAFLSLGAPTVEHLGKHILDLEELRRAYGQAYDKLHTVDTSWQKMKKNGSVYGSFDLELQTAHEKSCSINSELQALQEKYDNFRTSVSRIDEEMENIRQGMIQLKSYDFLKISISEMDTISDLQAKISKIDQKLADPVQRLVDDAHSLINFLPDNLKSNFLHAFNLYRQELDDLNEKLRAKRAILVRNLTSAENCITLQRELKHKLNEIEKSIPTRRKLSDLNGKLTELQEYRAYEKSLRFIKNEHIDPLTQILNNLELPFYRKPLKELFSRWQDLLQNCWENIMNLTQDIMQEQSRNNLRTEILEWIENTRQIVDESTLGPNANCLADLTHILENAKDLQEILKSKRQEIIAEFEADERLSMDKILQSLEETLNAFAEKLYSTVILWSDFESRMEYQRSFSKYCDAKFADIVNIESLTDKEIACQELRSAMKTKTDDLKGLQDESQSINELTGSYKVVQEIYSIVNQRIELSEIIRMEISRIYQLQIVKSQLISLQRQISMTINKLESLNVSTTYLEDLEEQENILKKIDDNSTTFSDELCKLIGDYDDQPEWPTELATEYDKTRIILNDLNDRIYFKRLCLQETKQKLEILSENENKKKNQRLNDNCCRNMSFVQETLAADGWNDDETNLRARSHSFGNSRRKASLKLDKFGKLRILPRKNSATLLNILHKKSFSNSKILQNGGEKRSVGSQEKQMTISCPQNANMDTHLTNENVKLSTNSSPFYEIDDSEINYNKSQETTSRRPNNRVGSNLYGFLSNIPKGNVLIGVIGCMLIGGIVIFRGISLHKPRLPNA